MPDPQKEINKLRDEIARHDALYYKAAQPEIDDQAYDKMKARLAELEAEEAEA